MIRRNGPINIKLDRKTARSLTEQAKARGLSLKNYLHQIASQPATTDDLKSLQVHAVSSLHRLEGRLGAK